MKILHNELNSYFQKESFQTKLKAKIILRRLQNIGFKVYDDFLQCIESQLVNNKENLFHFDFEDEQVPDDYKNTNEINNKNLSLELSNLEKERDEIIQEVNNNLEILLPKSAKRIATDILKFIHKSSRGTLAQRKKERQKFESNLNRDWRKPLSLLEELLVVCMESCADMNKEWQSETANNDMHKLEVLIRLHARACQISSEILSLLRTGHADGAHARWRSLHEIAIVGLFIGKHDDSVAERYIMHDTIECYKAAIQFQENAKKLGVDQISDEELHEICDEKNNIICKYGKNFKNEYGWASDILKNSNPRFSDIEKYVGLSHLRSYYKLASHNVHANSRGVFFKLGLMNCNDKEILAGPSNYGLADPGHGCALSLSQITIALLTSRLNFDRYVTCNVVRLLAQQIGDSFFQNQQQFEEIQDNHINSFTTHNN
jgi:hypothetical protein